MPEPSIIQPSWKGQVLGSSEAMTWKVEETVQDDILPWKKQAAHTERTEARKLRQHRELAEEDYSPHVEI